MNDFLTERFQHVVIGGGCAGLQVASMLGDSLSGKSERVLVLEKSREFPQRTWCFWTRDQHEYDHLVSKRWKRLRFIGPTRDQEFDLKDWEYQYIAGEDFFSDMRRKVQDHPNVEIRYEQIEGVEEFHDFVRLKTKAGTYQSEMLFNSLPDRMAKQEARHFLWQHFKGWFVKMDAPVFDEGSITLMDFRRSYHDEGTNFFYVLPFSPTEALIEFTVFSKEVLTDEAYDKAIRAYISDRYPGTGFEVEGNEKGRIPMTDYRFSFVDGKQMLNIGGRAGMVKPTTGYAFKRIMADIQQLRSHKLRRRYIPPSRFRFYDKLLLRILDREPHRFPEIMERLFVNQPIQRILRFLDESTYVWEEAKIFSRLPIRLFLKSLKDELLGA